MDHLSTFVPRSKTDLTRAEAAARAGYPAIEPVLPQLLEWLKDYNWPVARILAPLLESVGAPLVPHLRRVLEDDDLIWKYWVITLLIPTLPEADVLAFRTELERLALNPSLAEQQQELPGQAFRVLRQFNWTPAT